MNFRAMVTQVHSIWTVWKTGRTQCHLSVIKINLCFCSICPHLREDMSVSGLLKLSAWMCWLASIFSSTHTTFGDPSTELSSFMTGWFCFGFLVFFFFVFHFSTKFYSETIFYLLIKLFPLFYLTAVIAQAFKYNLMDSMK